MLKSDSETKAFDESKTLFSSIKMKVAKVTNDTRKGAHDQMNDVPADK